MAASGLVRAVDSQWLVRRVCLSALGSVWVTVREAQVACGGGRPRGESYGRLEVCWSCRFDLTNM